MTLKSTSITRNIYQNIKQNPHICKKSKKYKNFQNMFDAVQGHSI